MERSACCEASTACTVERLAEYMKFVSCFEV